MFKWLSALIEAFSRPSDVIYPDCQPGAFDPEDIRTYPINAIKQSGRFNADERRVEYRRRGKSPSGVIDGVYNDAYRGNDEYNDSYRDWEADA